MIEINDGRLIHLEGRNTSYIFRVTDTDHLEHVYYGKRLNNVAQSERAIVEKNLAKAGLSIAYDSAHPTRDLNNTALEASFEGKGDFRIPLIRVKGKKILDFKYSGHRVYAGIRRYKNAHLPMAVAEETNSETIEILLEERKEKISIILCYTLFKDWDIITRKTIVRNDGDEDIIITSCASMQLDLYGKDFNLINLGGAPLRELQKEKRKIDNGRITLSSRNMNTGFECNNVFALLNERNECYISGLIYSASYATNFEKSPYSKLHITSGINSEDFEWALKSREEFESPEAILSYSESGLDEAGRRFKKGIEKLVMRGLWKERFRPISLSTRDICGLDVNEERTGELCRTAKAMGFEAIILDDGWFGVRRDKQTSLGDWYVNSMKFPGGLKMLSSEIHREGLLFGLYFDIETVSRNSNLFKEKKDWAIYTEKKIGYAQGDDDYILDYTREDVQEWAIDTLSDVIEIAKLDYLRYEKSKLISDLERESADAFSLRYIMGIYNVLNTISRKFPNLLIETSFSGGGRFDLGMLSYSSLMRITANTDPISRIPSIEGARLFYPNAAGLVTLSTSPDKITGKNVDVETRFNVSIFNALEYSLDITKLPPHEVLAIKNQIEFYKQYRQVLQFGDVQSEENGERIIWSASNQDGSVIIVLYLQKELTPNDIKERLFIRQAREDYKYRIYSRTHVQSEEDELRYPAEIECYEAWGDAIKWAGIALSEKDGGTGYTEDMRKLKDNSSRLYILRKI